MKTTRSTKAFSMIDLLLIIAAVVGIAFIVWPWLAKSHRKKAARISCTNNLKQINYAFRIWAGDNNDKYPTQVSTTNGGAMELANEGSAHAIFMVMSNELNTPKVLLCPSESNRKRIAATAFETTVPPGSPAGIIPFTPTNNLSYFVGLDADDTKPSTFLAGDDHLSIAGVTPQPGLFRLPTNAPVEWRNGRHFYGGGIAMVDGSAQGFSTTALRTALANTGFATNRLAMP